MRTIAIMNNKGGVGKTVTALNLADILAHDYHKRVVLVDCDGQMSSTRFYIPDFDPDQYVTVDDVMAGNCEPVWSDNLVKATEGIDLLPASSGIYLLDVAAALGSVDRKLSLRDFRDAAAEDGETDVMIFDCAPGYTATTCAALFACDEVVIPTLADGLSIFGTQDMAAQIASAQQANVNIEISCILINQWHKADVILAGEQKIRSMGINVAKRTIRRTDKVPESFNAKSPLRVYSPHSSAAIDYRAWVRELFGEEVQHG